MTAVADLPPNRVERYVFLIAHVGERVPNSSERASRPGPVLRCALRSRKCAMLRGDQKIFGKFISSRATSSCVAGVVLGVLESASCCRSELRSKALWMDGCRCAGAGHASNCSGGGWRRRRCCCRSRLPPPLSRPKRHRLQLSLPLRCRHTTRPCCPHSHCLQCLSCERVGRRRCALSSTLPCARVRVSALGVAGNGDTANQPRSQARVAVCRFFGFTEQAQHPTRSVYCYCRAEEVYYTSSQPIPTGGTATGVQFLSS